MLEKYLEILNAWKFGYTRVFCKYFVSKKGAKNHLLYGMVGFTNEKLKEVQRSIFVETEQCIAGQEIFDLTEEYYNKTIKTLKDTPHIFFSQKNEFSMQAKQPKGCSMFFDPFNYPQLYAVMRSPYLRVSGDGDDHLLPDIKALDLELRSIDTPYEDTKDLMLSLGLSLETLNHGSIPHVEYILTQPITNIICEIKNRSKLYLKFSFPRSPQKEKFKVGVRLFKADLKEPRFCINNQDFKWTEEDGLFVASVEKEIEGIEVARILPSYEGHNIGSYTALDPDLVINDRPEIDKVFYKEQPFEEFLNSKNADEFEFGVSALLHYLKLSTQRYSGIKGLTDGPDVVAFSSLGHIYLVECTTGLPNHRGKLLKLHNRAEKLIAHYKLKGLNSELIRPILFTNISKENIHGDRAEAANFKISLVAKEDFKDIIQRIQNPPSDQELFQAALNAIPTKE